MLILPIVNNGKVFNVQVSLKNAKKTHRNTMIESVKESEVIVNGKKFSDSSFNDEQIVDFIRYNSLNVARDYMITTRDRLDSKYYDVYDVAMPPTKVNSNLDNLYLKAITDMRKEIPDSRNNGKYISFDKLGFNDYITEEKLDRLKSIVTSVRNTESWPILFEQAGVADIASTINFLNIFDCTVVPGTTIDENYLGSLLDNFEKIHSRDFKSLNNYYNIAKGNREVYKKLSKAYSILYKEPYRLIQSKKQRAKTYTKTMNHNYDKENVS